MEILTLVLLIELSGAEGANRLYEPLKLRETTYYDFTTYITMGAKMYFMDFFYISGSMKALTNLIKSQNYFSFTGISSYFEAGIECNGLSLGWRHFCTHPVTANYDNIRFVRFNDQAGSEFFLRFETKKLKVF